MSWSLREVGDECEGDRPVSGTMADGCQRLAPAAYSSADAPESGTMARPVAAGPRMDSLGHGGCSGTGPSHHRLVGGSLRRVWATKTYRIHNSAVQSDLGGAQPADQQVTAPHRAPVGPQTSCASHIGRGTWSSLPLLDEVCNALAHRQDGDVDVGPDALGHDRGVHDPQALRSVDPAVLVHHGHGV